MAWVFDPTIPRPPSPKAGPRIATDCRRLADRAAARRVGKGLVQRAEPERPPEDERRQLCEAALQSRYSQAIAAQAAARAALQEAESTHVEALREAQARAAAAETELAATKTTSFRLGKAAPLRWRFQDKDAEAMAKTLGAKIKVASREVDVAAAALRGRHDHLKTCLDDRGEELAEVEASQRRGYQAPRSRALFSEAVQAFVEAAVSTTGPEEESGAASKAASTSASPSERKVATGGARRVESLVARPAYAT